MKKIALIVVVVLAMSAFGFLSTACVPRENKLIICNWEDYIDPDIIKEFEKEYSSKVDGRFKVVYDTFSDNEALYSELTIAKKDYDLVVPSDYMVEKLADEGLLKELDWSKIPNSKYIDEMFFEDETVKVFDPQNKYAVPYVYGTFGIMYDPTRGVDRSDVQSWDALWSQKYADKISMKETARDSFTVGAIKANIDILRTLSASGYNQDFRDFLSDEVFNNTSSAAIEKVKTVLQQQRPLVTMYETDEGKDNMIYGHGKNVLGLFWSCDAGFAMQENQNIEYVVPVEGSNLWIDNFVIPSNAVNTDAAHAFLDFLCRKDIAMANAYYAGATSPITQANIDLRKEIEEDEEFFEGKTEDWKQMYLDTIFVTDDVIARSAVMRSFGNDDQAINEMWRQVRNS